MKVILFGATGFSGQAILAEALKQGHEVTILVRDASKVQINHKNLTIIEGNVLDMFCQFFFVRIGQLIQTYHYQWLLSAQPAPNFFQ